MNTITNIIKMTPPIVKVLQEGKTVFLAGAVGFTVILVGMPLGAFALDSGNSAAMNWMKNEKHSWHLRSTGSAPSKAMADQHGKSEREVPSWMNNEKHVWHLARLEKSVTVEKERGKTPRIPSLFTNEKHSWHMKQAKKP